MRFGLAKGLIVGVSLQYFPDSRIPCQIVLVIGVDGSHLVLVLQVVEKIFLLLALTEPLEELKTLHLSKRILCWGP